MPRERPQDRRRFRLPRAPYPFIYTKDAWDVRRFNPLGGAPNTGHLSRWAVRFAVALIVAVLGGSLLLVIIQVAQGFLH